MIVARWGRVGVECPLEHVRTFPVASVFESRNIMCFSHYLGETFTDRRLLVALYGVVFTDRRLLALADDVQF